MLKTRYHPLIDRDTEGNDKYPLFFTEDETAAASGHGWYLEEMFPRFYRLCRGSRKTKRAGNDVRIHCPLCGNVMDLVSAPKDKERRAMYMCRECAKERKV